MGINDENLIDIPREQGRFIMDRLLPLIEKHLSDIGFQSRMIGKDGYNELKVFDLNALCLSCYTQGLIDCKQVLKK